MWHKSESRTFSSHFDFIFRNKIKYLNTATTITFHVLHIKLSYIEYKTTNSNKYYVENRKLHPQKLENTLSQN